MCERSDATQCQSPAFTVTGRLSADQHAFTGRCKLLAAAVGLSADDVKIDQAYVEQSDGVSDPRRIGDAQILTNLDEHLVDDIGQLVIAVHKDGVERMRERVTRLV